MKNLRTSIVALTVISTVFLVSCGSDQVNVGVPDTTGGSQNLVANKIVGSVREWKVDVSASKANEGEVLFAIANFGTIAHEFLVVKTDFEPGKIPLNAENRFDEENKDLTVIDEISEWEPDTAGVLKVTLAPGNYQLLCNLAGHYNNGMFKAFTVLKK